MLINVTPPRPLSLGQDFHNIKVCRTMDIVNSKENLMYDPLGSHRTPIYACNTTGRSVVLVVLFCCKTEKNEDLSDVRGTSKFSGTEMV